MRTQLRLARTRMIVGEAPGLRPGLRFRFSTRPLEYMKHQPPRSVRWEVAPSGQEVLAPSCQRAIASGDAAMRRAVGFLPQILAELGDPPITLPRPTARNTPPSYADNQCAVFQRV